MKIHQEIKILEQCSKNAGPKGSPAFIRVLTSSIFQKLRKTGTGFLKPVLKIETSNKLHLVGKR